MDLEDILLLIVSLIALIVVWYLFFVVVPALFSKLFNVTYVDRRGNIIATPQSAENIKKDLNDLSVNTKKKIKSIKQVRNIFSPNNTDSKLEKLEKLNTLRKDKVISQDEFESLKSEILGTNKTETTFNDTELDINQIRGNIRNALDKKDFVQLEIETSKLINNSSNSLNALRLRCVARRELKKHEELISDLTKIIKIDPNGDFNYYFRAKTYYVLQKYTNALDDITKAIKLNPDKKIYIDMKISINNSIIKSNKERE